MGEPRIKICDFGLARMKNDLGKGTMQFSGTPAYMAPE
jgi:serine/threonine protein kinase